MRDRSSTGYTDHNRALEIRHYLREWDHDLERLLQNRLLDEGAFIRFARDRDIPVSGVVTGDPGKLHRQDLLTSDGLDHEDSPLFHPFRMYPLHKTLEACASNNAMSASLQLDDVSCSMDRKLMTLQGADQIEKVARETNQVADLAILLEPIYWPRVSGRHSHPITMAEDDFKTLLDQYRQKALHLVKTLDPNLWRKTHELLRIDAARMDQNSELYLLLRLTNWNQREKLRGRISGALWIRHIAEVIRRGFEEVHGEAWPEEDQAFGTWLSGGRRIALGSERPLDDELQSKPYLACRHGLFTGSAVRWYVEGETEYHAILYIIPEPSRGSIELVNLRGIIESERDNAALKLRDWLKEDKAFRRFSMISFDCDVPTNVKAIRRQVEQQHVVGMIAAHKPDFEFANFAIEELAEVAARIDEANGFPGDVIRNANWAGIGSGRAFEERYKVVSARKPRGLKGEAWGRALAEYMVEHPKRSDDASERPLWRDIRAALMGRIAHYDFQKERYGFNPATFELINIQEPHAIRSAGETGTTP